jgi:hypothetical protein
MFPDHINADSGLGTGSHGRIATADNQSGARLRADGRKTMTPVAAMTSSRPSQNSGGRMPT